MTCTLLEQASHSFSDSLKSIVCVDILDLAPLSPPLNHLKKKIEFTITKTTFDDNFCFIQIFPHFLEKGIDI